MKLATANYGFREWSLDNYLFAASGLGVKFVEIGYTKNGTLQELYHTGDPRRALAASQLMGSLADSDEFGLTRVKNVAKNAGVKLVSSTVNYRLWGVNQTWLDWAEANIKVDIEIGAELGLEVMRVTEIGYPPGTKESAVFDDIVKTGKILNRLGKYAENLGVIILAENYRASSDLMSAMASHFTTPSVGLNFDPHNYKRVGEDPIRALHNVKDYIRYCHIKDYQEIDSHILPTDSWWPSWAVGEGEIDWKQLFSELAKYYDGYLAVEYEKYLHDVLRGTSSGLQYIRGLLDELNIPYS